VTTRAGRSAAAATAAAAKGGVRRLLRVAGYELRPLDASFDELRRSLLTGCDLLVDVGANTGQYVRAVRSLGYCGRVLSFEPQQAAFDQVAASARRGTGWWARRFALADREGSELLRVSENSVSSSLLTIRPEHLRAAPASRTLAGEVVPVSTLDRQLAGMPGRALWLKLDVQGAELAVLRGGTQTLGRTVVVQAELSLAKLYEDQADWVELVGFLRERDFTMCHLLPGFRDRGSMRLLQMDGLFVRDGGPGPEDG